MVGPSQRPDWRRPLLPLLVVAAAAPLALIGVVALMGGVDRSAVLGSRAVAVFAGVTAILSAFSAGLHFAAQRRAGAMVWLAAAALAGEGAATWATRCAARLDLGVGEEGAAWAVERAALPGGLPDVRLLELPPSRSGEARLLVNGREERARLGRPLAVGFARSLVLGDEFLAPAFIVRRANGSVEGEGLIKLVPGRRDWFEVGVLPHRFYVTLTKDPGDAVDLTPPIHLRVQRGKLSVYEGDLGVGEPARVEGLSVVFEPGARWARLELRSRPTGAGALAALVISSVAWVLARRRLRSAS